MTDKEKLLQYIDYKGINKNQFYVKTGLSKKFLDSGKSLGVDKLRVIANNYTDLSLDWMVLNKGEMLKSEKETHPDTKKCIALLEKDNKRLENEVATLKEENERLLRENAALKNNKKDRKAG